MKINEIISEGKEQLPPSHTDATPGMKKHPGLDNSSPYGAYRFSAAFLPGSPDFDQKVNKEGPIGQSLVTVAYTDGDEKIIDAAEKAFGAKSIRISPNKSTEAPFVNQTSPVSKPKKNKYGI